MEKVYAHRKFGLEANIIGSATYDLKRGAVKHKDIGQMNMYLGYFAKEENVEGDNPPIGIIMSHYKDELMVEYAMYGMDSNLFVSKYELFLPNKEDLRKLVRNILVKK